MSLGVLLGISFDAPSKIPLAVPRDFFRSSIFRNSTEIALGVQPKTVVSVPLGILLEVSQGFHLRVPPGSSLGVQSPFIPLEIIKKFHRELQ